MNTKAYVFLILLGRDWLGYLYILFFYIFILIITLELYVFKMLCMHI